MKLFINDKAVRVIKNGDKVKSQTFDVVLKSNDLIISKKLVGDVLIEEVSTDQIERIFKLLEVKKLKKLNSLTFAVSDKRFIEDFIKDQFKIVKASGGLVLKGDMVLMIYRLSKWDLPKGKLKKKEDPSEGAIREVEEECSIRVQLKEKICATWHTYIRKGKKILKKTNWYLMDCVTDIGMQPQIEENIEEVRWMEKKEVKKALKNSYKSIEEVFERFYNEEEVK